MNKEIPRDMEIHPDFYKRLREANIKLERACGYYEENFDDRFGKALIVIALIIFLLILYSGSVLISRIGA